MADTLKASNETDVETGGRLTLDPSNSWEIEAIPIMDRQDDTLSVDQQQHNVVPQMTPLEFYFRSRLNSQTDNRYVQGALERLFLVVVFITTTLQVPLNYLLGATPTKQKQSLPPPPTSTRGMIKTKLGTLAYVLCEPNSAKATPILCFHAAARSADEFSDVLPLLAATGRRVLAIDLPGCGASENPVRTCTFDDLADCALQVADALLVDKFVVLGSLMGCYVGMAMASKHHQRVQACLHSHLLYHGDGSIPRQEKSTDMGIAKLDSFQLKEDGSHLIQLHEKYSRYLDDELTLKVVSDELTYLVNRRQRYQRGISCPDCNDYDLEAAASRVQCPSLCINGEMALRQLDRQKLAGTQRSDTACRLLPQMELTALSGVRSGLHMIQTSPKELASVCLTFLEKHEL